MATVWTITHKIIGLLPKGRKIVLSNCVPDTGTGGGTITIDPLVRILDFSMSVKDPGATPRTFIAAAATLMNQLTLTPSANATGAVVEILSIGL